MVDWSGAQRSRDCAQGVVQCHVQFLCLWGSAPDRCTVLGGGEDQSLGGYAEGLRAAPQEVPARRRIRKTRDVVFADIFSRCCRLHSKVAAVQGRQAEFLGQMERDFHVYDMGSPTLKILCGTGWTVQAASLSAILKNYGTLMTLWGWAQDNVSDSDMKARIIGVQTKTQTFSVFYGL